MTEDEINSLVVQCLHLAQSFPECWIYYAEVPSSFLPIKDVATSFVRVLFVFGLPSKIPLMSSLQRSIYVINTTLDDTFDYFVQRHPGVYIHAGHR